MKHINLTQMLQGCSKRNGMTVSASGSDGAQTCEVKRQTLSSKKEKWSKNEALHSTCLRSASDALSFRSRYLRYAAVIFCVLVMSIANIGMAWGANYYVIPAKCNVSAGALVAGADGSTQLFKTDESTVTVNTDISSTITSEASLFYNSTSTTYSNLTKTSNYGTSSSSSRTMKGIKIQSSQNCTISVNSKRFSKLDVIYRCASSESKTLTIDGEACNTSDQNVHLKSITKDYSSNIIISNGSNKEYQIFIILTEASGGGGGGGCYSDLAYSGGASMPTGWTIVSNDSPTPQIKSNTIAMQSGSSYAYPSGAPTRGMYFDADQNATISITSHCTNSRAFCMVEKNGDSYSIIQTWDDDETLTASIVSGRRYYLTSKSGSSDNAKCNITAMSFSGCASSCETLAAPTGLACVDQSYNTLSFSWDAVANASSYDVKLWTNSTCTGDPAKSANTTNTTCRIRDLSSSTTYYCKVQTKGDGSTYCTSGGTTATAASGTTDSETRVFKSGETVFFKDADNNIGTLNCLWVVDGGNVYAYFYNSNDDKNWASGAGTVVRESHHYGNAIYKFTVPKNSSGEDHEWSYVIFTRGTAATWDSGFWNQTQQQSPNQGENMFTISKSNPDGSGYYSGSWSTYANGAAVVGDMNNWRPDKGEFNYSGSTGTVYMDLEANTEYKFKVLDGTGWKGCGGTITNTTTSWWKFNTDEDCTVRTGEEGNYAFKWDNSGDDKYLGIYYPQARLKKGEYIYFDARDNSTWTAADFDARFWFKYYDSDSNYPNDVTYHDCAKSNAKDSWVYPYVVPNSDYIGQVQMNRIVSGSWNANADKIAAHTRTSSKQNCIKLNSSDASTSWTTYCPPMSSSTLSDNSTTVIAGTSGNGTEGNPYLVNTNGSILVTASATKAVDDPNMTINYDFKVGGVSQQAGIGKTYTHSSLTNNTMYEVSMDSYNTYNGATGTKNTSADHIWYKALNVYTISYNKGNYGEGSAPSNDAKIYGIALTLPDAAFTRTGYTQDGWSVNADGSTKNYELNGSYTANEDDVLYPHWQINNHTITYSNPGNGNSYEISVAGGDGVSTNTTADYNQTITLTANAATGYTFTGWTVTKASSGTVTVTSNQFTMPDDDVTVTASFTLNTYTVSFDKNEDSYGTLSASSIASVPHGSEITVNSNQVTINGTTVTATAADQTAQYTYAFSSWSNTTGTVTAARTITANFTRTNRSYTVTLNTNDGTINAGNVTSYTYGTGATLPTNVTKDDYRFMGWYDNEGLTGSAVTTIANDATGNKTYWAKWAQVYTITNGTPANGTITISKTSAIEGEAVTISVVANMGYTFNAWNIYKTSDAGTTVSPAAASASTSFTMPAYNVTVDATFNAKTTTITINANTSNHGSTAPSPITATYGSELPSFTAATGESGWNLTGYFTEATSGTKVINANGTLVASTDYADVSGNWKYETASLTLYAQYEAAAPAAECITWEGTPSSWTGDATPWTMTVSTNLVLKTVGKKWDINSSTVNSDYAKVWVEDGTEIKKTVIAIDKHDDATKYLQGSFADGSEILSLTIGAANNNSTAGTNKKYVVLFSATEAFTTVLEYATGKYAQEITAPSFKDAYNASNLEKAITVPSGAKFFRIYRKVVKDYVIGGFTADKDYGDGATIRIFKIEACPEGSACTDPTIAWDNTPANGLVGGSMTASVTSNYPVGVSYSSSDPTVASVNASTGAISYLKAGTTTITATVVGDGTTYCDLADEVSQEITVTAVATGIAISPATIDVQVGGTTDLTATLTPAGAADATVNWTSEYSSNATVAIIGGNNKTARVTGVELRPSGASFKIYAKTASLTANSWYATVRVYKGVTYNATTNGGTCATASAKYYGDAALVLPAATKDGYTFNGWYTTASGVGTKIGETGDEYTPSANSVTLYARFTENVETYAITYELNGGTHGSTYPATGTPDAAHELSAPTRSGYTFTGWSVSPVVSGAKWGTTSSPTTAIEDASTLAVNGTSSVYFKNLAAANGAVTITAHWTQDCETSGGGGGSTTLFNVDFTDETTEQIKAATDGASWVAKTYDTYSMSFGSKNADAGVIDIINETGLQFTGNNINNYNCLAIPLSLTKDKEVTAVITLGDATKIGYKWVSGSLPATPSVSSTSTYGTNSTTNTLTYTPTSTGNYVLYLGRSGASSGKVVKSIVITQAGGDPVVTPCYHVTYHANGAERGTVEDAARYVGGETVTVKPNGFTKTGADFLGWATSDSRADAGTVDYDPDDDEKNSFTMSTANVDLWAVWGTAAPRVYALTGSAYRCTGDAESTITLAGSETDVNYQLKKDGENDGVSVTGTGSALTWNKSAWGTYTVVATRSAVSVDMSGEVVLSDYPLSVTENLDGGTVAQDGEFTLSAKVSVNADNSDDYTYEWFSNNTANYDTPTSLGDATAMVASTGTQEFEYNPSTASGGTIYYFCKFTSPCGTVVRTRVVSVTVTTSTTTLTWDRDGEGDDFEDLPQGGKHTITVTSNSGVAPSLEVAGTDAEITNVEQEGSTTTATLVLGASAADVVLTAEVSANDTYAAKSEDKEVIVKECSSGETKLYEMHLTAYNTAVKDAGNGSVSLSFQSGKSVEYNDTTYEKPNSSAAIQITLGTGVTLQAGDKIVMIIAGSGDNKEGCGFNFCKNGSSTSYGSINMTLHARRTIATWTVPANNKLIGENILRCDRLSSDTRFYGISIVRGGGSGSAADVASGIEWIINPDPAITRSISNDPFTFAVQATTPSMGTITYASSNEAVATVDANGRVTLIGEGATTISAKQEAIGCYMASSTLSYSLTVETCTSSEPEPLITYVGTVICPEGSQRLTATGYIAGATIQWYKDGVEIDGADEATYDATEAGTYTVVAHKDCYSESSNSVTLTKMSATVDVKTLADEFTIKSERPYNFRLFEIEDGATMTVQSRSGIDPENSVVTLSGNIISISGTAPTIASAGDATIDIRISRTGGCSSIYVDKTVTIHKIPATSKKTIAWIATKTTIKDKKEVAVKGVKDEVDADKSSDVDLYQELEKYYTVTARNCYWTTSEAELVKEYSQYDLIVLTDYPNSQTAPSGNDKSKSYTNAIGLLKDHIPMLTFEAYVAQCPNWEIPSNPQNTSNTQNDITLLCNADDIFGTSGKFGAGSAISVSTVGSGQALQGFLPADAPFVFIGSITDDGTTYIACCERQVNPAARMMIFGLNANTMNNLTSDGKEMVRGFINYLMISDAASIPDCSVIFNGGAGDGKWETVGNWEGGTLPGKYASVRIDKPCVVSGDYVAEAGYLKIHTSSVGDTYTGKLTIEADGAMAIDGTITRVEDNRYTLHLPTRPEDLIIRSDASGQGALIFDNDDGETQATVELYSLGRKKDGHYQFQYYAVPMDYVSVSESFAGSDIYTYVWHEATGWERRGYYTDLYAFEGVGITTKLADPKTYTMTGTLASTATKEITLTKVAAGYNLIGNSWTAPIQISQLEEDNGSLSNKTVYIYNAGNDTTAEGGYGTTAGQWTAIPFNAAGFELWSGLKVIPAMQAFELVPDAEETLTLDYEKVVRGDNKSLTEPLHAPRRVADHAGIELMRIRVADSKTHTDLHLFEGERFSDEFDNGWEAAYMDGDDGTTKLYADVALGRMAVVATDELEGTLLGFAPGKETEYTFSFGGEGMGYYLNDLKLKTSTLISEEATYSFTYEEGDTNRFYISRTRIDAPQTPTGVENTHSDTVKAHKFIYNDKLYIMLNGRVYSAEGQIVK